MLPGVHSESGSSSCMFPWSIPELSDDEPVQAGSSVTSHPVPTGGTMPERKPVAFRAWCVEHAADPGDPSNGVSAPPLA